MNARIQHQDVVDTIGPPMGMLIEITHRCPMQCPYCSNPIELERKRREVDTATWLRVLDEAAGLGILQIHWSGGEPTVRKDLPELVRHAHERGLYNNIITSGVLLTDELMDTLKGAGADHVQISFQDVSAEGTDRIGGLKGAHVSKLAAAKRVKAAGLPLTLNFVVHRQNLDHIEQMIQMGLDLGAERIEIAHVQYYGWALVNRSALLPTRAQVEHATAVARAAQQRLKGRMAIDYVAPDYYAKRPKPCLGGWARRSMNVTPSGKALPCHAAETLPGFTFPNVCDQSLAEIWYDSEPFNRYRGTKWMPEPCQSCAFREIDWGGCRCQAFAMTGDAARTDPACELSPDHHLMEATVAAIDDGTPPDFVYRHFQKPSPEERAMLKTPRARAMHPQPKEPHPA